MRQVIPFNDEWLFVADDVNFRASDTRFVPVTLPHSNRILPHHNFDDAEYQFVSTYRKRFTLPEALSGRRVYLDFDGALSACSVAVNGQVVGAHVGGYTPFSYEITDRVHTLRENVVQVRLDSTEHPEIPPFGYVVDYLTFGGLYRDVRLRIVEPIHIVDVFARPLDVLTRPALEVAVRLKNQSRQERDLRLELVLREDQGDTEIVVASSRYSTVYVPRGGGLVATVHLDDLPAIKLWSLDDPVLYALDAELYDGDALVDRQRVDFGFREAVFRDDGFYLNGERIKLIGLNRHQTYPYIGPAAPARLQRKDAEILKYELGVNIARTSHYPQSPHFLKRCDEIGLLVLEELPGWQFVGDSDWQALALRDLEAMILRDRNHPSIVLWGVRINESADDEGFYSATNRLAHQLDPSRQTGGIRNFLESQFLEDVFTYNDFSNTVVEPIHTPHLITEFNGHMFPTKTWDNEDRQIEHALRHARIQDKQFGMLNVTGAIGWCAFDYNTHRVFGSGDRICYHGVMDIFRLPKFAAYVYESQIPPSVRPVLQIASLWTMGDRSEGGNDPLTVFSNCEAVEVYVGEEIYGRFQPDRETYPHLPYAPFTIPGMTLLALWGNHFQDLRVVGLINEQPVIEQKIAADGLPYMLTLDADDDRLAADGADMTRIVFKITDRFGNRLPYAIAVIDLDLDGPGELIGETPFPLVGGQAAIYVRAGHTPGQVTVRASTPRLESKVITLRIR
ncbi:MAG: hypothetical protein GYB67_16825 [Chloroflexi bacterium]|nr:hypothetical protein [Chloroflexota bacterium]